MYSVSEQTDMHYMYGRADGNSARARELYAARYPNRQLPCARTFARIHQRLRENGTFDRSTRDVGRPRAVRSTRLEERVLHVVDENPSESTRRIAVRERVSHMTIWRILHDTLLYPYHFQRVQGLTVADFEPRRIFCQRMLQQCAVFVNFLACILFTDEAGFTRDGIFNFHNSHNWAFENPHEVRPDKHQQRFCLNVWGGIIHDHLIGPYFFPLRLNGETYLQFLRDELHHLTDDVPLDVIQRMWFLHDGAPAHFSLIVRNFLNDRFPQRWVGRGGPMEWPARSPDLNPMDFFVWGHLKSLVYATPVPDVDILRERIQTGFDHIRNTPGIFNRVRQSMERRLRGCIEARGNHFEQFL